MPPLFATPGTQTRLLALIERRLGIALRAKDSPQWEKIFAARLQSLGLDEFEAYLELLNANSEASQNEWRALTPFLTNGESYFWRDKGQFALLAREIFPTLLAARESERTLRIWSAGCSTGEEPYSLAILWNELAPREGGWRIQLFASDLSEKALESARRGVFSSWSFRSFDEPRRERYFTREGQNWRFDAKLRSIVQFVPFNLASETVSWRTAGWSDFDLILCRNVLIYFSPQAISRALNGFGLALREGGFLMTGHAELATQKPAGFTPRLFPESVVYQKSPPEAPRLAPVFPLTIKSRVSSAVASPIVSLPPPALASPPISQAKPSAPSLEDAARAANLGLLDEATRICEAILGGTPTDYGAHLLRARVDLERGDLTGAKSWLRKAVYLAPDEIEGLLELAAVYEGEGDRARANTMRASALENLRERDESEFLPTLGHTVGELVRELSEAES